ncbi:4-hydroxybenzoate polyprenyltransferase [Caldimicrobium thiodismutans]|jgi:4-hydroxybenzoate polyprenyltransferase|uniref:4-hydroxybenzoate polyprenyltransferase n=1 Tax=Caldimicrobium thiodismutans TaxID=1653476 RepID=A0A0U4W2M1_9BACT|nr:UbiA-like polyprenyltransferase [Caldimicrobium thiodismutans]BAU23325.1 4-hydroxybenzoate polyprenyltransferase [Caldimicrobium thiodismutans]
MLQRLRYYSELIKLEHTIFALPFALASIVILMEKPPGLTKIFLILLALVLARSAGMLFNRFLDKNFDAKNPRTMSWPHARGLVKDWEIKLLIALSVSAFILISMFINTLALLLSPFVVLLLFIYPLAKRFTYYPHLVLGLVYFLIPIAVDVALNEAISKTSLLLGIAMAFWVSGFDILYSLQDYEFDLRMGLKSIPVRFGIKGALRLARFFHLITFFALLGVGLSYTKAGIIYFLGLSGITLFLIYEHRLISERDLSKINKAFFTINGFISILFFIVVLLDRILPL